jgi:hypothetical protein
MARTGPVTRDTSTIALGLAQIRVAAYSSHITNQNPALTASDSLGAMANTKFNGSAEYFKLESGFPMLEDATYPLREMSSIECAFKEITPKNIAIARGLSPTAFTQAHAGAVVLGTLATPVYLRVEAVYTFPDGSNRMVIIFPRAQATAAIEMEFAPEEPAAVAIVLEAKRADSEIVDETNPGNVAWDDKPLGVIRWDDGSGSTWTTTSTSTTTTTA